MNLSLERLKKYGFNRRELTERDFYAICEAEGIQVTEMDVPVSFYFCLLGERHIILNKKLKGIKKTFTMFHELAHHFLHGTDLPETAMFFGLNKSKSELEADAIALLAIIPKKIGDFSFLDDHPNRYAKKLFKDRQRLNFLYGI
jgi:Zn-dependent peptidase ImmA (M78 family)